MKKILIIDNPGSQRTILNHDLNESGYKTILSDTGENGINIAQTEFPDLIILEIMLSGMDGFRVCTEIKTNDKTRDIPIVFMSTLNQKNYMMKGILSGASDYIAKPFEYSNLYDVISKIIGKPEI